MSEFDYSELSSGMEQNQDIQTGIRASYEASKILNPEEEAKALSLSKLTGLPSDTVKALPQEAEHLANTPDFSSLSRENPGLSQFLSDSPVNASLVKDDLETAKAVEEAIKQDKLKRSFFNWGPHAVTESFKSMLRTSAVTLQAIREKNKVIYEDLIKEFPALSPVEGIEKSIDTLLKQTREAPFLKQEAPPNLPFAKKLVYDILGLSGQTAGAIGIGLAGGGPAALTALGASYVYGLSEEDLISRGVEPERAKKAAFSNAMLQAALEYPAAKILSTVFKATNLREGLTRFFEAGLAEAGTEFLQQFPDTATRIWAEAQKKNQGFKEQVAQFVEELPETLKEGAYEALTVAVVPFLSGAASFTAGKLSSKEGASAALRDHENITQLVTESKLHARSPDKMAELLSHSDPGKLYIPIQEVDTYFQSKQDKPGNKETIDSFAEELGIPWAEIYDARETGGEVGIDKARYYSKYSGSEFDAAVKNSLRLSEEGLSVNDTKEKESIISTIESLDTEFANLKEELVIPKQLEAIRTQLMAQKREGGFGLRAEDADAQLSLLLAGAKQLSKHRGENTSQWFDRVNPVLKIGGEFGKEKGAVSFEKAQTTINLFKTADFSTFLHETSHIFLSDMEDMVAKGLGDEQLKIDLATLQEFGGAGKEGKESIARAFEAYLREGKAPSVKLMAAFERFKSWLSAIYKSIKEYVGRELNPEVSSVFDRMLSAKEDLRMVQQVYGESRLLADLVNDKTISPKKKEKLEKTKEEADKVALEKQVKMYLRAFYSAMGGKGNLKLQAEKEINTIPVYRAIGWAKGSGGILDTDLLRYGDNVLSGAKKHKGLVKKETAPTRAKTWVGVVKAFGGLDPNLLSPEQKFKIQENGLFGLLRKGGMPFDRLVQEISDQYNLQSPENRNIDDYFLELLIDRKELTPGEGPIEKLVISLENLAAEFDFESPELLAHTIAEAKPFEVVVRERTKELISKTEMEIRDGLTRGERVPGENSYHTDDHLAFLTAVGEIYREKLNNAREAKLEAAEKKLEAKVYREAARVAIGRKKVSLASRQDLYARAEQKYADEAFKAAQTGDWEKAYTAKKFQILNHMMVQEAIKAGEVRQKIEDRYATKKLKTSLSSVENAFADAAMNIVSAFGLNPHPDFVAKTDPELGNLDEMLSIQTPDWVRARRLRPGASSYKDLPMSDLVELDRSIQSIIHYGQDTLLSMDQEKWKSRSSLRDASIAKMAALKDRLVDRKQMEEGSLGRTALDTLNGITAPLRIMEFTADWLDNFPLHRKEEFGPLQTAFMVARDKETLYSSILSDTVKKLEKPAQVLYGAKKRLIAEYGKKFSLDWLPVTQAMKDIGRYRWDAETLTVALLNTGNQGNIDALMEGNGFGKEQIDKLSQLFTEEELLAAQEIGNVLEGMFPLLDEAHFKTYNRHLDKVSPLPRTMQSKDGKTVTLPGWYFPMHFDHRLNMTAGDRQRAEDEELMNRKRSVIRIEKPKDNPTHKRTGGKLPLALTFGVLSTHIQDVARYVSHVEFSRDMNTIFKDKEWKSMVIKKAGRPVHDAFLNWVSGIARPDHRVIDPLERVLLKFKDMSTISALSLNIPTSIKQRLGIFATAREIGWKYTFQGFFENNVSTTVLGMSKADSWKKLTDLMPFLLVREGNIDREIGDIVGKLKLEKKAITVFGREVTEADVKDFLFILIKMNDRAVTAITARGALNKYLAEHRHEAEESRNKNAARYAEKIVSQTQSSSLPMDLSVIQQAQPGIRGGLWKLFTSFFTSANTMQNRYGREYKAWQEGAISTKEYSSHFLQEIMLAGMGSILISAIARGELPEWWEYVFGVSDQLLSGIPIARDVPNAIKFDNPVGSLPAFEGCNRSIKAFVSLGKGVQGEKEWDKVLWDLGYATEYWAWKMPALQSYKKLKKFQENIEQ